MKRSQRWWILAAMSAAQALSYLDITAVAVSLPQIQRLLHGSENQIHWVINAYLLTLAVFIITGGRLGDLYGYKRSFLSGAVLFLVTSIGCALAPTITWLIVARLFQGGAAALLVTNTASIMLTLFPPEERGKSNGIYLGIASIFLAFGPFIGGFLAELLNWRWVFWINVPLVIFSIIVAVLFLKNDRPHTKLPFDWLGLLTLGIAMSSLIISIMEGDILGWKSVLISFLLFNCFIFLLLFLWVEKKVAAPLIDFQLFKNRTFLSSIIVLFFLQAVLMLTIFMPLWYQIGLEKSPLAGGILALPTTVPILFLAPIVGRFIDLYGFKLATILGISIYLVSVLFTAYFLHYLDYKLILAGVIGIGVAIPMANLPIILIGLSSVPSEQRGMGVGIMGTARQAGATIGMAVMSALFTSTYFKHLTLLLTVYFPQMNTRTMENLKHLLSESTLLQTLSTQFNPNQITLIHSLVKHAYTAGTAAILYSAAMMLIISLSIVLWMKNIKIVETD